MTRGNAYKLVKLYVDGWKENNSAKILSSLSPGCKIIESHGPIYKGRNKVQKWIEVWIKSGGKVNRWDVISFYFEADTAIFEWIFDCVVNKKPSRVEGISIVHFQDNKINYLREYRMTKPSFEWNEKEIAN